VKLPKIYSIATVPTSAQYLASGQLTATAPVDHADLGWRVADALARIFTGQTDSALQQDVHYAQPLIWAKDFNNVPPTPTGGADFAGLVSNYQDQYKQLWGK
jgi:hypothetical protein